MLCFCRQRDRRRHRTISRKQGKGKKIKKDLLFVPIPFDTTQFPILDKPANNLGGLVLVAYFQRDYKLQQTDLSCLSITPRQRVP